VLCTQSTRISSNVVLISHYRTRNWAILFFLSIFSYALAKLPKYIINTAVSTKANNDSGCHLRALIVYKHYNKNYLSIYKMFSDERCTSRLGAKMNLGTRTVIRLLSILKRNGTVESIFFLLTIIITLYHIILYYIICILYNITRQTICLFLTQIKNTTLNFVNM